MPKKKEFARTIRMKESIRQYVEKQPGATFAEKFENMVLYCMVKLVLPKANSFRA